MTGWPSASPILGAMARAEMSVAPPGVKPTIRRSGREGKVSCAKAGAARGRAPAASRARRRMAWVVMA